MWSEPWHGRVAVWCVFGLFGAGLALDSAGWAAVSSVEAFVICMGAAYAIFFTYGRAHA